MIFFKTHKATSLGMNSRDIQCPFDFIEQKTHEESSLSKTSQRSSQRRLRIENTNYLKIKPFVTKVAHTHPSGKIALLAVIDRPAEDLQAVYDKYCSQWEKHHYMPPYTNLLNYFASTGDIDSVKTLLKYGQKPDKDTLELAALEGQGGYNFPQKYLNHEMVRLLADNGAIWHAGQWMHHMSILKQPQCPPYITSFLDTSEEKLKTLEYLLDHGTPTDNNSLSQMLHRALRLDPKSILEQQYKDQVIKMLLDRGAKLSP